jgi:aspartyl-tRNA(Asn)/glutamyl-tRNA(Gln) amidotransferase subunit B
VEGIRANLPELPDQKKARFMDDFGLSAYDAGVLAAERETAEFYETVVAGDSGRRDPKAAANWVTGELFGALNRSGVALSDSPVDAAGLGGLLDLIADKTISGRIAKEVFDAMWETGKPAAAIVEEKGLKQITDSGAIEGIVEQVIADNPAQAEQYKAGNEKLIGWFVGQVMKASQGKANPGLVNQILKQKLGG